MIYNHKMYPLFFDTEKVTKNIVTSIRDLNKNWWIRVEYVHYFMGVYMICELVIWNRKHTEKCNDLIANIVYKNNIRCPINNLSS